MYKLVYYDWIKNYAEVSMLICPVLDKCIAEFTVKRGLFPNHYNIANSLAVAVAQW